MISQLQFVFIAITVLLFLYMTMIIGKHLLVRYLAYRDQRRLRRTQHRDKAEETEEEEMAMTFDDGDDEPNTDRASAIPPSVMSRQAPLHVAESPVVTPSQSPSTVVTNGVAMRHNGHKPPIVHCEHATMLATETNDDPAIVAAVMTVLARLAVARQKDGRPLIGETALIRYGLQITPGGSNRLYNLARAALKAAIVRIQGRPVRDEIDDVLPDGSVVRRNELGQRYVIDRSTNQPVILE